MAYIMTERSTLVTAPNSSKVAKYELSMGSKVNNNEIVLNAKADELKAKMDACYVKLNEHFKNIATEYRNCANKSVKGADLVNALKKLAKNCENQGKYCLNRKKNLDDWFTKDQQQKESTEVKQAVGALESSTSSMNNDISEVKSSVNNLESSTSTMSQDISSVKSTVDSLSSTTEELKSQGTQMTNNINDLMTKSNDIEERMKILEDFANKLQSGNSL